MAIAENKNRSHVPRVHVYPHHVFIVVHAPEIGAAGHLHYLELDQFIGEDYLVTMHGPISPKVTLQAALRETEAVAARMDGGRLRPTSPVRAELRNRLLDRTTRIAHGRRVTEVRTVGLWAGVDLDPAVLSGRQAAEGLAQRGVLAKETHDITIRFAPPLIITEEELDWMLDQFEAVLDAATAH